ENRLLHGHSQWLGNIHSTDFPTLSFNEERFFSKRADSLCQPAFKGSLITRLPIQSTEKRTAMPGKIFEIYSRIQFLQNAGFTRTGKAVDDNQFRLKMLQTIKDILSVFFISSLKLKSLIAG